MLFIFSALGSLSGALGSAWGFSAVLKDCPDVLNIIITQLALDLATFIISLVLGVQRCYEEKKIIELQMGQKLTYCS